MLRDGLVMEKYNVLQDRLTNKFIVYQWRLDNPMPTADETVEKMRMHYLNNPLFHARVCSLVAGVIDTVIQWEKECG